MAIKALKHDHTNSVLITDGNIKTWFDLWIDDSGDITGDWNKYIFDLNDDTDIQIFDFQKNAENFEDAMDVSIDYLTKLNILTYNSSEEMYEMK